MSKRAVLAGLFLVSTLPSIGLAGEPIRFVRPKEDKAPLRHNFSAEKLQSREDLGPSSLQSQKGSDGVGPIGGIPLNRKGRTTRRSWDDAESPAKGPGPDQSNTPRPESSDEQPDSPRGRSDGGNFAEGPFGSRPVSSPGQSLMERAGADNRAALRSLIANPFGTAEPSRGDGMRGAMATPAPGREFARPTPGREGLDGTAPRPEVAGPNPAGRGPGLESPLGGNSIRTEGSPAPFDPRDRPLRSNFEIPTRPR